MIERVLSMNANLLMFVIFLMFIILDSFLYLTSLSTIILLKKISLNNTKPKRRLLATKSSLLTKLNSYSIDITKDRDRVKADTKFIPASM